MPTTPDVAARHDGAPPRDVALDDHRAAHDDRPVQANRVGGGALQEEVLLLSGAVPEDAVARVFGRADADRAGQEDRAAGGQGR